MWSLLFAAFLLVISCVLGNDFKIGIWPQQSGDLERWRPTIDYLNSTLFAAHGWSIHGRELTGGDEDYLNVDFVVSPPVVNTCLDLWGSVFFNGTFQLVATVGRMTAGVETHNVCGITVVRQDRTDLQSSTDVRGARIEMVHPLLAEHGQLQMYELANSFGVDTIVVARQIRVAYSVGAFDVVHHILDGSADVGFIRMDQLDLMQYLGNITQAQRDQLRILNPKQFPGFPHVCSTIQAPDWSFFAPPWMPLSVVEIMAGALRSITPGGPEASSGQYYRWVPPQSSAVILQALNRLRQLKKSELVTSVEQCPVPLDIYETFKCPEVYEGADMFKVSRDQFETSCSIYDLPCPAGYICFCSPCKPIPENRYAVFISIDQVRDSDIAGLQSILRRRAGFLALNGTAAGNSTGGNSTTAEDGVRIVDGVVDVGGAYYGNRTGTTDRTDFFECRKLTGCLQASQRHLVTFVVIDIAGAYLAETSLPKTISVEVSIYSPGIENTEKPLAELVQFDQSTWLWTTNFESDGATLVQILANNVTIASSPFVVEVLRACPKGWFKGAYGDCMRTRDVALAVSFGFVGFVLLFTLVYYVSARRSKDAKWKIRAKDLYILTDDKGSPHRIALLHNKVKVRLVPAAPPRPLKKAPYAGSRLSQVAHAGVQQSDQGGSPGPSFQAEPSVKGNAQVDRRSNPPFFVQKAGSQLLNGNGGLGLAQKRTASLASEYVSGPGLHVQLSKPSGSGVASQMEASAGNARIATPNGLRSSTGPSLGSDPAVTGTAGGKGSQAAGAGAGAGVGGLDGGKRLVSFVEPPPVISGAGTGTPLAAERESADPSKGSNTGNTSAGSQRAAVENIIRLCNQGRHNAIAIIYGYVYLPDPVTGSQELYIVEENSELGTLADILDNPAIRLEVDEMMNIAADVASGMAFLHAMTPPVVHGALKASAVLVNDHLSGKVAWRGATGSFTGGKAGHAPPRNSTDGAAVRSSVLGSQLHPSSLVGADDRSYNGGVRGGGAADADPSRHGGTTMGNGSQGTNLSRFSVPGSLGGGPAAPGALPTSRKNTTKASRGREVNVKTDIYDFGHLMLQLFVPNRVAELCMLASDPDTFLDFVVEVKSCDIPLKLAAVVVDCFESDLANRPSFDDICRTLHRAADLATRMKATPSRKGRMFNSLLVDRLYPADVAEDIKQGRTPEPKFYPDLTILFCDIVGYTEISSKLDARDVQHTLNTLYSAWEKLIAKWGVFRLEIIGDCWIVVGNLSSPYFDHTVRTCRMAMDMISIAKQLQFVRGCSSGYDPLSRPGPGEEAYPISIRVGIHAGPAVGSVLSSDRPRYTLLGDTMNTASRMESNSRPNCIHLSQEAADRLKQQSPQMAATLISRGTITVKGKGLMATYWLPMPADLDVEVEDLVTPSFSAPPPGPATGPSSRDHLEGPKSVDGREGAASKDGGKEMEGSLRNGMAPGVRGLAKNAGEPPRGSGTGERGGLFNNGLYRVDRTISNARVMPSPQDVAVSASNGSGSRHRGARPGTPVQGTTLKRASSIQLLPADPPAPVQHPGAPDGSHR